MDKFLETYSPPKLNQEEIDNLKTPITRSEIESIISKNKKQKQKQKPCKQKSRTGCLQWGIYQTYKEELISIFLKLFQNRGGNTPKVIL